MPVSSTPHPARLLSISRSSSFCWCGIHLPVWEAAWGPCWVSGAGEAQASAPLIPAPPLTAGRAPLLQAGGEEGAAQGRQLLPFPSDRLQYWLLRTWVGQEGQEGRGLEWWVLTGWMRH